MSCAMKQTHSYGAVAAVFAVAAGLVAYEFVPRRATVNVVSMDRVFHGEDEIARYLITDDGQPAGIKEASRFAFPEKNVYVKPLKATCIRSHDWRGGPAELHDCERR